MLCLEAGKCVTNKCSISSNQPKMNLCSCFRVCTSSFPCIFPPCFPFCPFSPSGGSLPILSQYALSAGLLNSNLKAGSRLDTGKLPTGVRAPNVLGKFHRQKRARPHKPVDCKTKSPPEQHLCMSATGTRFSGRGKLQINYLTWISERLSHGDMVIACVGECVFSHACHRAMT